MIDYRNLWGRSRSRRTDARRGFKAAIAAAFVGIAASIATALPASAQIVTIQQVSSGRYLDAWQDSGHDYRAVIWSQQNNDTQRWRMTNVGGDVYTLQQVSSDRYLDAWENSGNDFNAVTRPNQNNNTQRWLMTDLGGGIHRIQQVSTGRYLDAWEDAAHDYRAVTRPYQGNATQQWRVTIVSYEINPELLQPEFELVFPLDPPLPPPPPPVHSSGTFEIGAPSFANLDNGATGYVQGDFQYAAPDFVNLQLIPRPGAQFSFTDGSERGYAGCSAAAFSSTPVMVSSISPGDFICARTDEGRISEFRINSIGPVLQILSISSTTWQ